MIVVTGATGELGRAVVENLLRYVPAARVAVSVRKPEDAQAFAARGVAVRRGDFDEPESLVRSFVGADRLLIVSASGIDHESRAVRHRNALTRRCVRGWATSTTRVSCQARIRSLTL